ncbi:DUF6412 domain-containing protein [Nocardia sp. NPDC127579]|uniref:DUF6412 domain-containing protein n=1 Tax=Nocardia sp. NPDC127579 TaxID=3345402 RepID=UPI00362ECEBE
MTTRTQVWVLSALAFLLPALAFVAGPANESAALAILGVVAASALLALVSLRSARLLPVRMSRSGPPAAAQRRRRGSYLRQSNPDTAGRPRPRAPGLVTA